MADPRVESLIERFSRRHAETLAAITAENSEAIK
jgi:hypothetical protein